MSMDSLHHDVARVHGTVEQLDVHVVESMPLTHKRRRSHSSQYLRCWHCGHTGHIRRHCFRRMRQQRQRSMHDAEVALTSIREAVTVAEYASDGDVTFASSVSPAYFDDGCSFSPRWLLDADATFHVTPQREWFSSFSSGRLGHV